MSENQKNTLAASALAGITAKVSQEAGEVRGGLREASICGGACGQQDCGNLCS